MSKGRDGEMMTEKEKEEKEKMMKILATNVVACRPLNGNRLHRRWLVQIMAEIVAPNIVASRPPNGNQLQWRPLMPISISMCGYVGGTRWGDATILTVTKE